MPFICRVYTPPTNFTFSQHPFPSASGSSAHYTYGPKKAFKKYSLPLSEILHTVSFFNPQESRVPEKLMITPCLRLLPELSTFKQRRYSHSHLCEQCFPPKTTSDTTDGLYVQSSKIRCEDKKLPASSAASVKARNSSSKDFGNLLEKLPSVWQRTAIQQNTVRQSYRVLSSNAEGSNCCQRGSRFTSLLT